MQFVIFHLLFLRRKLDSHPIKIGPRCVRDSGVAQEKMEPLTCVESFFTPAPSPPLHLRRVLLYTCAESSLTPAPSPP